MGATLEPDMVFENFEKHVEEVRDRNVDFVFLSSRIKRENYSISPGASLSVDPSRDHVYTNASAVVSLGGNHVELIYEEYIGQTSTMGKDVYALFEEAERLLEEWEEQLDATDIKTRISPV